MNPYITFIVLNQHLCNIF